MQKGFEQKFTGWSFITSAILLLSGWLLLPHHIDEFFVAEDFKEINKNLWYWIWMFRIHIFGWVIMAAAFFSFSALTLERPYRTLMFPSCGLIIAGSFVMALGVAFYYSFGAWGTSQTYNKSPEEISQFMQTLMFSNDYAACLVRFGKVFSGVGFIFLGIGIIKWKFLPSWIAILGIIIGIGEMFTIMILKDGFDANRPLFYVKVFWMFAIGTVVLKSGIKMPTKSS